MSIIKTFTNVNGGIEYIGAQAIANAAWFLLDIFIVHQFTIFELF